MRHIKFAAAAVITLGALWLATPASALDFVQPAGSPYATGELESNSVRTGDINGDGRDDVFTVNADYSTSVFLSNEFGAMTQAAGSPISSFPHDYSLSGELGDFNGDGDLDMVIGSNGALSTRLGNGNGTFGLPIMAPTASNGEDMAVADVNGDGDLDLLVLGYSQDNVSVMFGDGAGDFHLFGTFGTPDGPVSLVVDDFNGDNRPDVATANLGVDVSGGNALGVWLNNGFGTFSPAPGSPYTGYFQPYGITSGDFNGDGVPDLAEVARPDQDLLVLLGDGTGAFDTADAPPIDSNLGNSVASADFDGDGFDDVLVGRSASLSNPLVGSAPIFLGNSAGDLIASPDGPWATTSPAYPWTVATGDFNDDGHEDWVSGDQGGRISVFMNEAPALQASAGSVGFGPYAVGSTAGYTTLTLTSSGIGSVAIPSGGVTKTGPDPGDFPLGTDTCSGQTLAQGATCSVQVAFSPTVIGSRTATLSVAHDGGDSPASVALGGTGEANPGVTISPGDHDFGTVGVFGSGTPQVFTIESTGTTELDIASASLTGSNSSQFAIDSNDCPASLQPNEDCEVTVNYTPTVSGPAVANLALATNALDSPQTATLRGSAQFPGVTVTPNPVDFGPVPLNDGPSEPMMATIGASGVDLEIEEVRIYTNDFADFTITSDDCTGETIEPGQTCDFEIEFEPGALGERDAMIRIAHASGVSLAPVEGEGVANPSWGVTPGAHDFGTRLTGEGPGTPQVFTLTSMGTTDLETGAVSLSGAAADQFQITADGCSNQTLAPEATCEISVAFAPTTAGEKVADLHIETNTGGGPANGRVTGSGQDPIPPPDPCEPVAIKKVGYFTPSVKKRSNIPGVRARITTAGPADVRISSKLIYHLKGKQGVVKYPQRQFAVASDSVNYKVAIPKKLRGKLKPKKQVRFVITYASKATNPECTKFGENKTRNLTTRVVWVIPNG